MITRHPVLVSLTCLCIISAAGAADTPPQLASGTSIPSPDNRFTAVYDPDQLYIRSEAGDEAYKIDGILPVYALKWSRDATTLVIVQHLAGGSGVIVAHLGASGWRHFAVSPPGEYDKVAVVRLEVHDEHFVIWWKVKKVATNTVSYHLCKARFNPTKRKLSNVEVVPISVDKFDALNLIGVDAQ